MFKSSYGPTVMHRRRVGRRFKSRLEDAATTVATPPTEAEPPPRGGRGGDGTGGQPAGSLARGGGEQGDPCRPAASRWPTAAGKRPVQAGLPGLSTPSKHKKGRGVVGNSVAGRALAHGRHRPAAARSLFAPGFTRTTVASSFGDEKQEEQGGALVPPRGADTPGKGYRRASSEET